MTIIHSVMRQAMLALFLFLSLLGCNGNHETASQITVEKIIKRYSTKEGKDDPFTKLNKDIPIYQYYQKILPMSGVTNDPNNLIFNLQIELGYTVSDLKTLEKLSKFNTKIAGDVRQSIAAKTKVYLGNLDNYSEIAKDILELVNKIIAPDPQDPARIQDVIIVELFLHDYR